MTTGRVSVDGLKDLERALQDLSKAAGKGVLRRVGKKALKPVIEAAKENVPVASGELRDSLAVSTKLSKRQKALNRRRTADGKSTVEVYAGAGASPQAHLIEFGTASRVVDSTGKNVGSIAPQPFMRPAWDAKGRGVLKYISNSLGDEIEKTAKRAAKRAAKRR
ncbi:MAG: hypothetical protein COA53_06430 [Rhodobacteraceae bacterium]|nr:MAG: hypothetical protein COA53_06430 [Paracoccaceae bacterium]